MLITTNYLLQVVTKKFAVSTESENKFAEKLDELRTYPAKESKYI